MFQKLESQEEHGDSQQKITNKLVKQINKDEYVEKLIDLMCILKNTYGEDKQAKSICILNQKDKNDADPLVDLEIEGYDEQQVVLDFGSQVNING